MLRYVLEELSDKLPEEFNMMSSFTVGRNNVNVTTDTNNNTDILRIRKKE